MSQLNLLGLDLLKAEPDPPVPAPTVAPPDGRVDRRDVVRSGCVISADERYRYVLPRLGLFRGPSKGRLLWVMVNPSKADGEVDDPTVRRCMGFSESLGYADMHVVNLFAWRETDPVEMVREGEDGTDIIGPENDEHIVAAGRAADMVIVGWGSAFSKVQRYCKRLKDRDRDVLALLSRDVYCLGYAKDGKPRHPLMMSADAFPLRFKVT